MSSPIPKKRQPDEPGGYCVIPKDVLRIWRHLPERFIRLLPQLFAFASENGEDCFPGQDTVAYLSGVKRKAAWSTIQKMEQAGLVVKVHRRDPTKRNANTTCLYKWGDLSTDFARRQVVAKIGGLAMPQLTSPDSDQASCVVLHDTAKDSGGVVLHDTGGVSSCTTQGMCRPERRTTEPLTVPKTVVPADAGRAGTSPVPNMPLPTAESKAEPVPTASQNAQPISTLQAVGKAKAEAKQKQEKLTQADITTICSSPESMTTYILWGKQAVYDPAGTYPPAQCNWRKFMTPDKPRELNIDKFGTNEFMGYFWYCVSIYRKDHGLRLTLPMWGRLAGDIKNLQKTMTNWQLNVLILTVCQWFDGIKLLCGKAGQTMELNESSLSNGLIRSTANSIAAMTKESLIKLRDDYQRSIQPRM